MTMNAASIRSRIRYSFENVLSNGTIAIIGLLAAFSVGVISAVAAVIFFSGLDQPDGEGMSFTEAAWQAFLHAIDSGTVAGNVGWPLRLTMLIVTLSGIFIVSILIGTITSGLEAKLHELRKGRSKVLESNHTLILGWSSKIYSIISELVIANENQYRPRIVILASKDKVEMEDEIKGRLPDTKNTRIICRTGSPLDLVDLELVNPNEARSIIVLSPEGENADTDVIKSILALTNGPSRSSKKLHIVAEIQNAENVEAAELVGKDEATLVLSSDIISKVMAQTCRQSGLSTVYTELLDFEGAEIYFAEVPELIGKTFKDSLFSFETSTVIGIRKPNAEILINPAMSTLILEGDKVIVIATDDDTIIFRDAPEVKTAGIVIADSQTKALKERTLILGWNERGSSVIKELDNYVSAGSEVLILAEFKFEAGYLNLLQSLVSNQVIAFQEGNVSDRKTLDSLNLVSFDHIIILCYQNLDVQQADARTLIALLHLRNISEQLNKDFSIVSEMLDIKNRDLAQVAKADDFIVSDKLVSLILSQLSENGELKHVFDQLFAAEGSEIYLKPVESYFEIDQPTDFYSLVESAARRGETAIGYRRQVLAHDPGSAYGVVVNPGKSEVITFAKDDKIIVMAET